jgi:hypothetical protein
MSSNPFFPNEEYPNFDDMCHPAIAFVCSMCNAVMGQECDGEHVREDVERGIRYTSVHLSRLTDFLRRPVHAYALVLSVACPACRVQRGLQCVYPNSPHTGHVHRVRVVAAFGRSH